MQLVLHLVFLDQTRYVEQNSNGKDQLPLMKNEKGHKNTLYLNERLNKNVLDFQALLHFKALNIKGFARRQINPLMQGLIV